MALGTYDELQDAIADWMVRSDLAGNAADWVTLAEARLNRELNPIEVDQALTGTSGSRTIDVSALSIVEPIALWRTETGSSDEVEVVQKNGFAFQDDSEAPMFWEYDADATTPVIRFNTLLDAAYAFRFRYRQRFVLSDAAPTNWLLTNHPDVYLSASLMWGGGFTMTWDFAAAHKAILDEGIPSVRNIIAQQSRAIATVDPALVAIGRYNGFFDGTEI